MGDTPTTLEWEAALGIKKLCAPLLLRISMCVGMASLLGCETFMPAHPYSDQSDEERVIVQVTKREASERPAGDPLIAAVVPLVADYAIRKVGQELEAESKRYTADYAGFVSDSGFYPDESATPTPVFAGIEVRRLIKSANDPNAVALYLKLGMTSSGGGNNQYRLSAQNVVLSYAKAKVPDQRWYLPWSWGGGSSREGRYGCQYCT